MSFEFCARLTTCKHSTWSHTASIWWCLTSKRLNICPFTPIPRSPNLFTDLNPWCSYVITLLPSLLSKTFRIWIFYLQSLLKNYVEWKIKLNESTGMFCFYSLTDYFRSGCAIFRLASTQSVASRRHHPTSGRHRQTQVPSWKVNKTWWRHAAKRLCER